MLRKILDYKMSFFDEGRLLNPLRPLAQAGDTFFYEPDDVTKKGPHIRDAVDLKRWMIVVVFALLPCILMAIWNTGLQKFVYASANYQLMEEYLAASMTFDGYKDFVLKDHRWLEVLKLGALAFFPVVLISYMAGGLVEGFFACIRRHEIAEGFLVTGILVPLVLPPTIPYWMVALGVAFGVFISKEVFGGTGMNIMNPALTCRAFLFFSFPNKLSGDVWVGTNPTIVAQSISEMSRDAVSAGFDGYSQATMGAVFNIPDDIKRVHVDTIAGNTLSTEVPTQAVIDSQLIQWNTLNHSSLEIGEMTSAQVQGFVTSPLVEGGLGMAAEKYQAAAEFAALKYQIGHHTDGQFFFGDMLGSMGETSTFACFLGALILIYTGVGSWRTMLGVVLGVLGVATLFEMGAVSMGADGGAWNPAKFDFPAYRHLLFGGLAFGLVFMATDPVSSPALNHAKWLYGLLIGAIIVIIRTINPAYPEGTMLAILLGNVAAPLIDHYAVRKYRSFKRVRI